MQKVFAEAARRALQLSQRQAALAASQLHGRPTGLQYPHQGSAAILAQPLPALPLLPTPLGSPAGLLTPPSAPHVLSLMLASAVPSCSASGILSSEI